MLDLYTATDSHDGGALVAYRKGDYKVVVGEIEDQVFFNICVMDQLLDAQAISISRTGPGQSVNIHFLKLLKCQSSQPCALGCYDLQFFLQKIFRLTNF